MNFNTHNTNPIIREQAIGTGLQGYITADYAELVSLFGEPTKGDGMKVDAEWYVLFEDNTFATLYNYKDGKAYMGEQGKPVQKITNWHIGGQGMQSVANVQIAVDLHRETRAEKDAPKDGPAKAFADAMNTRESIIESLIAHRGEKYKDAVIAGVCAMKLTELCAAMIGMLKDHGMPGGMGKAMREAHGQMVAQMLGAAARAAGIEGNDKVLVDELMEWATKINNVEQGAAKKIVEHIEKDGE